jgi:hypothetical protein
VATPSPPVADKAEAEATVGASVENLQFTVHELAVVLQACCEDRATPPRLTAVQACIDTWFAQMQRLPAHSTTDRNLSQAGLLAVCLQEGLGPLAAVIVREAPVPGRLGSTRGDWLELLRLFVAVRAAVVRSGGEREANEHSARLAAALFAEGVGYAAVLNQRLFSEDGPELARLAADFLRLDTLQWALEELDAERELYAFREITLLLANQVMSRINAIVRQFTADADPLARFNVAALLLDIEELITLAGRLLEPPVELAAAGGDGNWLYGRRRRRPYRPNPGRWRRLPQYHWKIYSKRKFGA